MYAITLNNSVAFKYLTMTKYIKIVMGVARVVRLGEDKMEVPQFERKFDFF